MICNSRRTTAWSKGRRVVPSKLNPVSYPMPLARMCAALDSSIARKCTVRIVHYLPPCACPQVILRYARYPLRWVGGATASGCRNPPPSCRDPWPCPRLQRVHHAGLPHRRSPFQSLRRSSMDAAGRASGFVKGRALPNAWSQEVGPQSSVFRGVKLGFSSPATPYAGHSMPVADATTIVLALSGLLAITAVLAPVIGLR